MATRRRAHPPATVVGRPGGRAGARWERESSAAQGLSWAPVGVHAVSPQHTRGGHRAAVPPGTPAARVPVPRRPGRVREEVAQPLRPVIDHRHCRASPEMLRISRIVLERNSTQRGYAAQVQRRPMARRGAGAARRPLRHECTPRRPARGPDAHGCVRVDREPRVGVAERRGAFDASKRSSSPFHGCQMAQSCPRRIDP